jgi:hypothetical protein
MNASRINKGRDKRGANVTSMKTCTQRCRFIQPKRHQSISCHEQATGAGAVHTGMKYNDDPILIASSTTGFSIGEEIGTLEHMYGISLLKWDSIRKMDEHEHALMQGKVVQAYEEAASQEITRKDNVVASAQRNYHDVRDEGAKGKHYRECAVLLSAHVRTDWRSTVTCVRLFVSWFILLLALLWVSYIFHVAY